MVNDADPIESHSQLVPVHRLEFRLFTIARRKPPPPPPLPPPPPPPPLLLLLLVPSSPSPFPNGSNCGHNWGYGSAL